MKIHFIAIGGAVMHNLAIALKQKGYEVTGSDDEIFDPARSNLDRHGILPDEFGWFPERISAGLDAVVLGMHAKPGNPELEKAQQLGIKIYSFPEYLYDQSKNKKRVVVAGSHGKTTITSIVMHVLKHAGVDFDYLVGARIEGFDVMVRLTDAPLIVIEGDEYLSSALDHRPKFLHYHPHIALISGIAWDHINVFPDFDRYVAQFAALAELVQPGGKLIYCGDDKLLEELMEKTIIRGECKSYGLPDYYVENGKTYILPGEDRQDAVPLRLFGQHNMLNINGARMICNELGVDDRHFFEAIKTFRGAANRLELLAESTNTTVYRDFAHAPSKLKATVDAVRSQYPERRLVAVMELHTYSSLSKEFLIQYRNTMDKADDPVVYFNPHAIALKKLPGISVSDVIGAFANESLHVFTDSNELERFLTALDYRNTNLLLMSSGNFGGIDLSLLANYILPK